MEFTVGERICCVGRTGWSKQIEKSLSISFFLFHIEFLMDQRLTCSDSTVRPTPMQACQHYRVACKCNHKTKKKTSKMKRKMFGVTRNYDNTHIVWGLSHAFNEKKTTAHIVHCHCISSSTINLIWIVRLTISDMYSLCSWLK